MITKPSFFRLCAVITLLSLSAFNTLDKDRPLNILNQIVTKYSAVDSASFTVENMERIGDEFCSGKQKVHYTKNPFSCKLEFIHPNEGATVFYSSMHAENELVYEPNGFPYFNFSIDPLGKLARKNNHHTIFDAGFGNLANVLHKILSDSCVIVNLESETDSTYNFQIAMKGYRIEKYIVGENQSVTDIADEKFLIGYKIIALNEDVSFYDDVEDGQQILIPTKFCKRIELRVQRTSFEPVRIAVFDEIGLFEEYKYSEVKILGLNIGNIN